MDNPTDDEKKVFEKLMGDCREVALKIQPNPSCSKCHGRGYKGWEVKAGNMPAFCKCLAKAVYTYLDANTPDKEPVHPLTVNRDLILLQWAKEFARPMQSLRPKTGILNTNKGGQRVVSMVEEDTKQPSVEKA